MIVERSCRALILLALLVASAHGQCMGAPDPQSTPLPLTNFRPTNTGGGTPGIWTVGPSPFNTVVQSVNSNPTAFVSDFDGSLGQVVKGNIQALATNGDDDFIGFIFGMTCVPDAPASITSCAGPGLVFDWKRGSQTFCSQPGPSGTAVSAFTDWSTSSACDLWTHTGTVNQLARGNTLGSTGYVQGTDYNIVSAFTRTRLQIWIDLVLEFDITGDFPQGRNGFFGHSQEDVQYSDFDVVTAVGTHLCIPDPVEFVFDFTYSGSPCNTGNFALEVVWDRDDAGEGTSTFTTPTTFSGGRGTYALSNVYNNPGGHIYEIRLFVNGVQAGPTTVDFALVREPVEGVIAKGTPNGNCGFDSRCDAPTGQLSFITSIGGTPGYSTAWNDGDTTCCAAPPCGTCDTVRSVLPGTYSATLFDSQGCSDLTNTVTITGSQVTSATITQPVCGSLDLTAAGTCGPFTYMWTTIDGSGLSPTDEDQSGLSDGTYFVEVTDANGCTRSTSFTLGFQITVPEPDSVVFMYLPTEYAWEGFQAGTMGSVFVEQLSTGETIEIFSGDVSTTTSVMHTLYAITPGSCIVRFEATGSASCSTDIPFYLCANDVSLDGRCDRR